LLISDCRLKNDRLNLGFRNRLFNQKSTISNQQLLQGVEMNCFIRIAVFILVSMTVSGWAQAVPSPDPSAPFAPFEQWKSAVLAADAPTLKALYSTDPPAHVDVGIVKSDAEGDANFWLGLKARSMDVHVIRNEPRHGHISYIFRAEVQTASGAAITITDDQSWLQQGDQWRLISVERTDTPHLKQPSDMKKNIYPADADARAEIKEAEERATPEHKRLLLVFGANWCFDCHVLDLAFHGPALAPIVAANYEVVHIDLGPDEHKNADLVQQFQVPLDKGIPALAVAESDGTLVVSQKNGEFEDARGLTPEVLTEFLNKWRPQAQ
jgi:thioredoxin-related protein